MDRLVEPAVEVLQLARSSCGCRCPNPGGRRCRLAALGSAGLMASSLLVGQCSARDDHRRRAHLSTPSGSRCSAVACRSRSSRSSSPPTPWWPSGPGRARRTAWSWSPSTRPPAAAASTALGDAGAVVAHVLRAAAAGRPRGGVAVAAAPDGYALVLALPEVDVPALLKWPNDVLLGEHKVAGILVERVETPPGPAAVLGVGINVSTTADELPVETATSWRWRSRGTGPHRPAGPRPRRLAAGRPEVATRLRTSRPPTAGRTRRRGRASGEAYGAASSPRRHHCGRRQVHVRPPGE